MGKMVLKWLFGALKPHQVFEIFITYKPDVFKDAKCQVLANLANFAYEPINYPHPKRLNVAELFLDMLSEPNEKFVEFGISGLCNYCLEQVLPGERFEVDETCHFLKLMKLNNAECRRAILENAGIQEIVNCLSSANEETVLSAITTLIYLMDDKTTEVLAAEEVIECMNTYSTSSNTRLSNLAKIYLQNFKKT